MNTPIKVNKAQLIETLTTNRATHREQFLTAQKRYREAVIHELDRMLADARDGRKIRRSVTLPEPQDYTSQFDTILEMLNWEVADLVELEERDFARFVLGKWEWQQAFTASTEAYLIQ